MTTTPAPAAPREISAADLFAALARGEVPQLVDLRNPDDAAATPLEGPRPVATTCIPLWHVLDDPAGYAGQIAEGAVLLCAKGNGSAMVADLLAEHGRRTRSLAGGTQAWSQLLVRVELPTTGGLRAWQFQRPAKGCLSYLLGVPGGGAVVVDPARHLAGYLELLEQEQMTLLRVVDTHLHADHVSGGPALAEATGAGYALPVADAGVVPWPTQPLADGEQVRLAPGVLAEIVALHLPGHTPGTTAVLVRDQLLMSGDTVFVRGVGRPDLTGQAETLARALFASVRERLAALSPQTLLLPAHWSSAAEFGPQGRVAVQLGEVLAGDLLAGLDVDAFISQVLRTLPAAPAAYDRIRAVNAGAAAGAEELDELEIGRNQCAAAGTTG